MNSTQDNLLCWNQTYNESLNCENEIRPFVPELWIQLIWSLAFFILVIGAVSGNAVVIYIIVSRRSMRTKTNIFFLNLSIADLMMATVNAMFNFVYMLTSNWIFGYTYCKINNFAANLSVAASVFTITATTLDRYMIVLHPLRQRMSKRTSAFVVFLIWILAAILALPALINSAAVTFTFAGGEERTVCTLEWSDGFPGESKLDHIYSLILFVFTYAIPMLFMGVSYTRMAKVLWNTKTIGEANSAQIGAQRAKQKVVPMLITVTVVFAICWLPYHLYFLYIYYDMDITGKAFVQHLYLTFYFLAMSNSLINPIIYCLLNQRFRRHFVNVVRCLVCVEPSEQSNVPRRRKRNRSRKLTSSMSTRREMVEML